LGISFSLESFSGQYPSRLQMARAEVVSYIQKGSMNCQERGLSEALRHKPLHVWSLTLYDAEHFFAPNDLNRYSLGTTPPAFTI
jgi:hypothetical protein